MKLKSTYKKIALALVLIPLMSACIGHYERLNRNPNEVTDEEKARDDYAISAALVNMQSTVVPTNTHASQYIDCLLGGSWGGYFADSKPGWNEGRPSTYDAPDSWTKWMFDDILPNVYTNYNELRNFTDAPIPRALAEIIKVAAMHRVTDTYGPIQYSKIGLNGQIQVEYDSQKDIYIKFFEELDGAIKTLTERRNEGITPASDVVFRGDLTKWIKFANSLKLRLALRVVYTDLKELAEQKAVEAVSHEVGVIVDNADNAAVRYFGEGNPIHIVANYNSEGSKTGGDHHTSADITTYMNSFSDPRRSAYFLESQFSATEYGSYVGLRNGIQIPPSATVNKYAGIAVAINAPLQWINAAEVAFLKAEGALRGWSMGGSAQELYEKGVKLSFEQWNVSGAEVYLQNTAALTGYVDPEKLYSHQTPMSSVKVAWQNGVSFDTNLEQIIVQKWIANWTLGIESWTERRRTGFPKLMPVAFNGSNGVLADGDIPRRLRYTAKEYSTNEKNVKIAISTLLKGTDNMATRIWWDCNPNSK